MPRSRSGRRRTRPSRGRSRHMASEKRTGMTIPAGILQPTTPPEDPAPAEEGQGGDSAAAAPEPKLPRVRKKKAAGPTSEKVEGRRLYLSEDVHFRLRML